MGPAVGKSIAASGGKADMAFCTALSTNQGSLWHTSTARDVFASSFEAGRVGLVIGGRW